MAWAIYIDFCKLYTFFIYIFEIILENVPLTCIHRMFRIPNVSNSDDVIAISICTLIGLPRICNSLLLHVLFFMSCWSDPGCVCAAWHDSDKASLMRHFIHTESKTNTHTYLKPEHVCCLPNSAVSFRKRLSSFIMFVLNDEQIVLLLLALNYKAVDENEGLRLLFFSVCLCLAHLLLMFMCVCNRFLDALFCLEYKWLQ